MKCKHRRLLMLVLATVMISAGLSACGADDSGEQDPVLEEWKVKEWIVVNLTRFDAPPTASAPGNTLVWGMRILGTGFVKNVRGGPSASLSAASLATLQQLDTDALRLKYAPTLVPFDDFIADLASENSTTYPAYAVGVSIRHYEKNRLAPEIVDATRGLPAIGMVRVPSETDLTVATNSELTILIGELAQAKTSLFP